MHKTGHALFLYNFLGESIILHENAEYIIRFIGEIVYNQNNLRRYCNENQSMQDQPHDQSAGIYKGAQVGGF